MDSDKHLYEIFEAYPQWVFELTGRPWPGPCRFQSVTIKAIQHIADGVSRTYKDGGNRFCMVAFQIGVGGAELFERQFSSHETADNRMSVS